MIKPIMMIVALMVLAGCASWMPGDFCIVSQPIRPSSSDQLTEGTARQVLAHNEYGRQVCRWAP